MTPAPDPSAGPDSSAFPGPPGEAVTAVCRDCGVAWRDADDGADDSGDGAPVPCAACGGTRVVRHPELGRLAIAHLDCDAFYATIEKRDDPALADRPVVVGGRTRGVVAAACYVARRYGIRSAMPMFQALERCPDLVVIPPNRDKYLAVGRAVRERMREVTPLVEPLSIDEAFLDLSADAGADGAPPPAVRLVHLVRRIERDLGITASIGLSGNKFLAKIASDLDKPRGFAVIGMAEAAAFLAGRPVRLLPGVGPALERRLAEAGLATVGDVRAMAEAELVLRFGAIGRRLARFARGEDGRKVTPVRPTKSVSAETTFERNTGDAAALARAVWPLAVRVAGRLARARLAATTATLKLKTADFRNLTRSRALGAPTQRADVLFEAVAGALAEAAQGTRYRLVGIGAAGLVDARAADPPDLFATVAAANGADEDAAYDPVAAVERARAAGTSGPGRLAGGGAGPR
jgi:DNA polymerase-4